MFCVAKVYKMEQCITRGRIRAFHRILVVSGPFNVSYALLILDEHGMVLFITLSGWYLIASFLKAF